MKAAVKLRVRGLVQGVYFRANLSSVASDAHISGWVRNMVDGSVEALLEGEEEDVESVVRWARRGPPGARVDSVQSERVAVRNLKGFRISD